MKGIMLQTQDTINKTDVSPVCKSSQPPLRLIDHWYSQIVILKKQQL